MQECIANRASSHAGKASRSSWSLMTRKLRRKLDPREHPILYILYVFTYLSRYRFHHWQHPSR